MNRRWPAAIALWAVVWYASDSLRHRREGGRGYELQEVADVGSEGFLRAAEALTGAPVTRGNRAELLINGDRIFPAFLETIAGARRTLNLLTYVYWTGEIAEQVADAVCERAEAGVECRVLLDAVGAVKMDGGLIRRMEDCGVVVRRFRPPKPYALRRANNRTHRKILVADGTVGLTGGVGIAEEWTGDAQDPDHWRDTHVRVRGPVVRGLQGAFAENWLEATGQVLAGEDDLPPLGPVPGEDGEEGAPMQVIRSSAGVGDTNVETLYYLAIASASRSILLTSAYFAPRPAFLGALEDAARRGVDVRVLVPGEHIDKDVVRRAGRATYGQLLRAGARVFEYAPTMLHAKCMVVDGVWSAIGSANFDNRSFQLNDEAVLAVQDRGFARLLTESFEADTAAADEVSLEEWARRPLGERLREAASRLLRREL
ncbi:phospholipase D-like domain-containing protein [Miltoncostaea marina]|uniref:phospholipase D-like domain-containing protein n=1 Tax=Miltoncostaea marina TaxID=2843215 RepID=UPI001C3C546A|nr:phospholipase D-like domain-containing protein [Miltoncostaea marina]